MRDIIAYRAGHGYGIADPSMRKMLWEVTRVIGNLPDDLAAVGWLQSAGPNETVPVILGYQQLCLALDQPQPEADAICLARLSLVASSFRLAACRFAEWWFDQTCLMRNDEQVSRWNQPAPAPYPAESSPQDEPA